LLAQDQLLFWTNESALDSEPATESVYFPPPVYSISGAPDWMRFDRFTGVFHGVPPRPGKFSFTITARDTLGLHSSAKTTVTVITAPVFTSPGSATFFAGRKSRFRVTATGVPAPAFDIGGPALPGGLTFTSGGLLSGRPAAGTEGTYQFFVGANNDPLGPVNVVQALALHIVRGHAPKFTAPASKRIRLRAGHHATVTIRASGVPAALVTIKGKLPRGLVAKKSRHGAVVISGSPAGSAAGHDFLVRVTASNIIGHVTETLVIAIG
jgi:large repetitive protein